MHEQKKKAQLCFLFRLRLVSVCLFFKVHAELTGEKHNERKRSICASAGLEPVANDEQIQIILRIFTSSFPKKSKLESYK